MEKKGSELSPDTQKAALARYVHRYTGDHRPLWVDHARISEGKVMPVHFASDAEWLAHTLFHVKADGTLDGRYRYCESSPTFPYGREIL